MVKFNCELQTVHHSPARYKLDDIFRIGFDRKTQNDVRLPRKPTIHITGCRYVVVYLAK